MNISWTKHAVWSPVIVVISQFVHSQCLSYPGYFSTHAARMRDASDVICFHMTSHIVKRCLFSTNIASWQKSSVLPRRDITFGDHGFDLFNKIMEFYICRCVCNQFVVLAFGVLGVRCVLCWSNLINWISTNFSCLVWWGHLSSLSWEPPVRPFSWSSSARPRHTWYLSQTPQTFLCKKNCPV